MRGLTFMNLFKRVEQVRQASDIKQALLGRQPKVSYFIVCCFSCCFCCFLRFHRVFDWYLCMFLLTFWSLCVVQHIIYAWFLCGKLLRVFCFIVGCREKLSAGLFQAEQGLSTTVLKPWFPLFDLQKHSRLSMVSDPLAWLCFLGSTVYGLHARPCFTAWTLVAFSRDNPS